MQIVCFSYICTTVCTGTCGLTLGVHVCLRVAEMEITKDLSIIFLKLSSIIIISYIIILCILLYIICIYIQIYTYIFSYVYYFIIILSNNFPKIQLSVMAMAVTIMPFGRPISPLYHDIHCISTSHRNIRSVIQNLQQITLYY